MLLRPGHDSQLLPVKYHQDQETAPISLDIGATRY
jgi:hypothetical protein